MKKMILVSVLMTAALSACTPSGDKTTTDPATESGGMEPGGMEPGAKVAATELLIKAGELRVDGGIVWFEPDSGVMRSSYTRYAFDQAEFEKIVGSSKPEADLTAIIEITKTEQKNSKPSDPNSPSPDGGFDITIHHAKILRLK